MKIAAKQLLSELTGMNEQHLKLSLKFKSLSLDDLNNRSTPDAWSALECIEHLNRYGEFYLPAIYTALNNSSHLSRKYFKSGILGNYFAQSMLPKEKLNKMKTFTSMNPAGSELGMEHLDKFIAQLQRMKSLLIEAESADLQKIKTPISISKWIKLRLGDTFRVVIFHNERHILQAQNALKS